MKSVLLISQSGFLGGELARSLRAQGYRVKGTTRGEIDLGLPVEPQLDRLQEYFDSAVICAAITDVEAAYRDPALSQRVNVEAMRELFRGLRARGTKPAFFSSDLVFDGRVGFYREDEPYSPTTLYGRQKARGEELLREICDEHLIFRTSKLMSFSAHPRNILTPIIDGLRLGKVVRCFEDQTITPVFIEDVARVLGLALEKNLNGTFHLATRAAYTRVELARKVSELMGCSSDLIQPIRMSELKFSEPRGASNTINAEKICGDLNFEFREIEELKKWLS